MIRVFYAALFLLVTGSSFAYELKVDGSSSGSVGMSVSPRSFYTNVHNVSGNGTFTLSGTYSGMHSLGVGDAFFVSLFDVTGVAELVTSAQGASDLVSFSPFTLVSGHSYALQFFYSPVAGSAFNYQASISPVPLPAAVWLFGSAFVGLVGLGRHRLRG